MTSLIRYYDPLERAFGALFAPANGDAGVANRAIALDVVETPEAYIVEADGKSLWKERSYTKASRAIRLPEAVDANAAQAKHVDGVLQLTLPKIAKANARQITIQ